MDLASVLVLMVQALVLAATRCATEEYCQLESFHPSCPEGQVILMNTAQYGRMRLGRCLTRDYYVGCQADVLMHLDQQCSGRSSCSVQIPNPSLLRAQPCPRDLVAYLEASYTCVHVASWNVSSWCETSERPSLYVSTDQLTGYISSDSLRSDSPCPLNLRAVHGQRINLTVYDFTLSAPTPSLPPRDTLPCTQYATVREVVHDLVEESKLCSGDTRGAVTFTSKTNQLELLFHQPLKTRHQKAAGSEQAGKTNSDESNDNYRLQEKQRFLVQFQGTGCADPESLAGMLLQRRGQHLDATCNSSGQVWHLVCRDNAWVGRIGNCSSDYYHVPAIQTTKRSQGFFKFPTGIVLAVVTGVALGILIGFCLLLIVHTVRRRKRRRKRHGWMEDAGEMLAGKPEPDASKHAYPAEHRDICELHLPMLAGSCAQGHDSKGSIPLHTFSRHPDHHVHVYEKPSSGVEVQTLLGREQQFEGVIQCPMHATDGYHRRTLSWRTQRTEQGGQQSVG